MLGLIFFIPAVNGLLEGNDYVLIPLYFSSILLFVTAKKRITVPRMGLVKFGDKRRNKSHVIVMILALSVVFLVFMVVMKKKRFSVRNGGNTDRINYCRYKYPRCFLFNGIFP